MEPLLECLNQLSLAFLAKVDSIECMVRTKTTQKRMIENGRTSHFEMRVRREMRLIWSRKTAR
jgi:hypothetical protein